MNLKYSLFTLATALCLGWLTVGCQEEIDTDVQPVVEPSITKESSLTNARVIDSTQVYDLSITVFEFVGDDPVNKGILEKGEVVNQLDGVLTLALVDSITTREFTIRDSIISTRAVIFTGSYVFTDISGATFEREATVLTNIRFGGGTALNPQPIALLLSDLPDVDDVSLQVLREGRENEDRAFVSDLGGDFTNRGDKFDTNDNSEEFVLNYTGDYREPATPLACGAEFVTTPNAVDTEVIIRPGDRFGIPEEVQQIPGLARVEYRLRSTSGSGGQSGSGTTQVFIGTATEGDFSIAYQPPITPRPGVRGDVITAYPYNEAGELLDIINEVEVLRNGEVIPLVTSEFRMGLVFRNGELVTGDVPVLVRAQIVDEDGLIRRYGPTSGISDEDRKQLVPAGGTVTFTYTAECTDTFDAILSAGNIEGGNGAISISVNGGPEQRIEFEEFGQDFLRRPRQVATTAALELNLQAGENAIVVTSLEDRETDLFGFNIARAPQDIL